MFIVAPHKQNGNPGIAWVLEEHLAVLRPATVAGQNVQQRRARKGYGTHAKDPSGECTLDLQLMSLSLSLSLSLPLFIGPLVE